MKVELQILDPRLAGWGFPSWGSSSPPGSICMLASMVR